LSIPSIRKMSLATLLKLMPVPHSFENRNIR